MSQIHPDRWLDALHLYSMLSVMQKYAYVVETAELCKTTRMDHVSSSKLHTPMPLAYSIWSYGCQIRMTSGLTKTQNSCSQTAHPVWDSRDARGSPQGSPYSMVNERSSVLKRQYPAPYRSMAEHVWDIMG